MTEQQRDPRHDPRPGDIVRVPAEYPLTFIVVRRYQNLVHPLGGDMVAYILEGYERSEYLLPVYRWREQCYDEWGAEVVKVVP